MDYTNDRDVVADRCYYVTSATAGVIVMEDGTQICSFEAGEQRSFVAPVTGKVYCSVADALIGLAPFNFAPASSASSGGNTVSASATGVLDYRQGVIADGDAAELVLSVSSVTEYDVSELSSLSVASISIEYAEEGKVNTAEFWLVTGESTVAAMWPDGAKWYDNESYYKLSARTRYRVFVTLEPDGSMVLYAKYDYYQAAATDEDATITSVGVFFPSTSSSVYGRRFARYSDGTTKYGSYIDGAYTEATGLEYCTYLAASTNSTTYTLEKGTRNDFDGLYPWSEMKRETIEGNVMILVPKFAMRVLDTEITYDSFDADGELVDQIAESGMLVEISVDSDPDSVIGDGDDDFRLSRTFMRPDGGSMDWYGVGAYEGTSQNVSGIDCLASLAGSTRAAFTALAKALNVLDGYDESSWNITTIYETQELMIPLMWVESACRSTQAAYGQGFALMSAASVTGLADAINYYYPAVPLRSGNITSSTTGTNAVVYRGIENPHGNIWKCVNGLHCASNMEWDGVTGYHWIVQGDNDRTKMGEYNTEATLLDAGYVSLGYGSQTTSGYVTTTGVGHLSFLPTGTSSAAGASTYYGDYTYATTTSRYNTAFWGGSWSYGSSYGSVCWSVNNALGNSYSNYGARLSLAF